jgi:hypothetical protein
MPMAVWLAGSAARITFATLPPFTGAVDLSSVAYPPDMVSDGVHPSSNRGCRRRWRSHRQPTLGSRTEA